MTKGMAVDSLRHLPGGYQSVTVETGGEPVSLLMFYFVADSAKRNVSFGSNAVCFSPKMDRKG
ncbi:MAG: hypothetical protein A2521_14355 [Deltaproteobacteria bacterium RIFOXYD12_FULL_57_12]|nr:MAG: hypothetical protein A2521_14355 [Deltaproteobacteria bacterium RIFOXYD12_FULL_57_12]